MNWLRRVLHTDNDAALPEPVPPANLAQHDVLIGQLAESLWTLQRINREPITARVRGQYERRPAKPVRPRKDTQ